MVQWCEGSCHSSYRTAAARVAATKRGRARAPSAARTGTVSRCRVTVFVQHTHHQKPLRITVISCVTITSSRCNARRHTRPRTSFRLVCVLTQHTVNSGTTQGHLQQLSGQNLEVVIPKCILQRMICAVFALKPPNVSCRCWQRQLSSRRTAPPCSFSMGEQQSQVHHWVHLSDPPVRAQSFACANRHPCTPLQCSGISTTLTISRGAVFDPVRLPPPTHSCKPTCSSTRPLLHRCSVARVVEYFSSIHWVRQSHKRLLANHTPYDVRICAHQLCYIIPKQACAH